MTQVDASFDRLTQVVANRESRDRNYHEMVTTYYQLVNDLYCAGWGESHHIVPMAPEQTLADAHAAAEQQLAEQAGLGPGMTALDVGSGVGGPALAIARHSGAHVTGIDLSPLRVSCARERAEREGIDDRASFVEGDAQDMAFPTGSFDVTYSLQAICHAPDKKRVHAEMFRVLKSAGLSLGYDWLAADNLSASEIERYIEPICRFHGLSHLSTPGELHAALTDAGFNAVHVESSQGPGMERAWTYLDDLTRETQDSEDPLVAFMSQGVQVLCEAARAGAFLIVGWTGRKPA
ncbi:methyltransferase domain-containing protein [Streptomyces mirabilis]|nr:methyltransferase domain-containing protein [Streptomyces mirabilis]